MRATAALVASAAGLVVSSLASAALPAGYGFQVLARTNLNGSNNWNVPAGSVITEATPDLNNQRQVVTRVLVSGAAGRAAIWSSVQNNTVYTSPENVGLSDPSLNDAGTAVFSTNGLSPEQLRFHNVNTADAGIVTGGFVGTNVFGSPRINDSGQVSYRTNSGSNGALDTYSPTGTSLVRHAVTSNIDPVNGYPFLFTPSINDSRQVAMKVQSGSATNTDQLRLFGADGTSSVVLASETGAVSSSPFSALDNAVSVNKSGSVVFQANLAAGGRGVYVASSSGQITTITTTANPLTSTVQSFTPDINDEGVVVFRAQQGSVQGIYIGDGTEIRRILAVGDTLTTDLGVGTISGFRQNPRINEFGDIVITAVVSGQGDTIVLATVPEPASLSLLALGGVALLRRRRA